MVRILKNLSEHLRSFRLMTATRLRTQEIEALIDELGLTPEMMGAMQDKVRRLSGEARNFSRQIEKNTELIDAYKARIAQYREEIADLNSIVDLQRKSYVGITRQLAKTANDATESAGIGQPTADVDPFLDVFQQELEQDRRGSSDETRHRLGHYLAHIDFLADLKKPKVVDFGSEAGEWIKMLAERGQSVTGVFAREADASDVDADKDTEIVISDPLAWMQEQKDRSVDLITAFQVIERMPFDRLVTLLREVFRVLKPGGRVILETPNPESLLVGAYKFWLDPARQRPLPPELMERLMHSLAFDSVEVIRLHPDPRATTWRDRDGVPQELCNLIAGFDDYAIVAERR